MSNQRHRFRGVRSSALATLAAVLILTLGIGTAGSSPSHRHPAPKATIVLVHGAWADASSWSAVTASLQHRGFEVIAPANPLRGLASDSEYLSSVLTSIRGPIILVGHSYGGMVITNAAASNPNVKALVYIAAFAPDQGDTLGGLGAMNPGSMLTPDNLTLRPYPGGLDAYITPSVFRKAFAADLSGRTASTLAAQQRPIAAQALGEPAGLPAWKTIPSWYLVATRDHAIPPVTQRSMAKRAGAHTSEVRSSHAVPISHPDAVSDVIRAAARAT